MSELKKPLVALLIAPDQNMRDAIHAGRKTITIREGHRDYRPGQRVMLCCPVDPWCVQATITEVSHCTMADVTPKELEADGFEDLVDAVTRMRRFYPSLTPKSPVTVIRWTDTKGYWVDHPDTYSILT